MRLAMYAGQPYSIREANGQVLGKKLAAKSVLSCITHPKYLRDAQQSAPEEKLNEKGLQAPIRRPRQIFASGVNYRGYAEEAGLKESDQPVFFSKFTSSLTGPNPLVELPNDTIDWETELVVVIGEKMHKVTPEQANAGIFGYMVGQDLTDRNLQYSGNTPQWGLSKSYPRFSAIGPWITTPDEITGDLKDLRIQTHVSGQGKQDATVGQMIHGVPELLAYLAGIVTLLPGDLVFTGTPSGIGYGAKPQTFLHSGDFLSSDIAQLGELCVVLK